MSFTDELFICSSTIHGMPSHTKHSCTSSASCHHPERISCKIADRWKHQSVVSPPMENVATPLYRKLSAPLNFLLLSISRHALRSSVPLLQGKVAIDNGATGVCQIFFLSVMQVCKSAHEAYFSICCIV